MGTVSVGNEAVKRTITNVAAGCVTASSTDAINGSQLFAVTQSIDANTQNIAKIISDTTVKDVKDVSYIKGSNTVGQNLSALDAGLKTTSVLLENDIIYRSQKKRRGRSAYLLSVEAEAVKDGERLPVRLVYVRNKNKRSDYLVLVSTDLTLSEEEIIQTYGKRWNNGATRMSGALASSFT